MKTLIILTLLVGLPPTAGYMWMKIKKEETAAETGPCRTCAACQMGEGYTCLNL